ncbi:NAD(P)/FAD-dependent oxidoreductase [Aquicoccus porphyridii]|uniref:Aminoacetone oxidase family FAD-binding enzyme n=1 Tax=Aquicoccus porphyridii TaxID=1852029 RepID=A0A5A9ZC02_9RHOB|nr:aminoacetone oxidase family FAD-binding enzyme [Aquicoccus porphyridii]KAA0914636.1 aminoacetone oxidase family FAD-binding enzyme [Aquicoccus porphyridii]RAI53254.1 aminoacetone oxidase family FAD-binding enzyme [Rhodobacteraceae bacterium AsT-22]
MQVETLILGAGAAGMMCAAHAGPGTLVIDHARAPGEKIRISGGGRCNFTNLDCGPAQFHGTNPHFAKSALARYTHWEFISLISEHGLAWHEKTLGQLFLDDKATGLVDLLRGLMARAGAELRLETALVDLCHDGTHFHATLETQGRREIVTARRLVVATGGKSIPKMGASGLAYDIARQFGHALVPPRPALVPFTFPDGRFASLAGVSLPVRADAGGHGFDEAMLFTHRGLSGPAILQISSFWAEGQPITIDLAPGADLFNLLRTERQTAGRKQIGTALAAHLPARLAQYLADTLHLNGNLADQPDSRLRPLCETLHHWRLTPSGTEGWRTAEVTAGGVATDGISPQSMMSKTVPGLYFIGECVDVTGWLGGYNFQWAWSSAMAAARALTAD